MPLKKLVENHGNPWGLWKIEENEDDLARHLPNEISVPDTIRNESKRLEWLAGRLLVMTMMEQLGLSFRGIIKNEFGKPFPAESSYHLSLSHSYPNVAAFLHQSASVGIDLEQPKSKLLRIAPRILDPIELADAGEDLVKHCIYWCAKEVMVKVHGKKDLIFAKNLKISPFLLQDGGEIVGRIIVDHHETTVNLQYELHPGFTVVLNKPN